MDKVESPQVVITEENLTGLPFLRNLCIGLFNDWDRSDMEETQLLMDEIKRIFMCTLTEFDTGFDAFEKELGHSQKANVISDRWRVFLMTFITELGDEADATLTLFISLAKRLFRDATGGDQLFPRKLMEGFSSTMVMPGLVPSMRVDYVVLLALRFYVASVTQAAPKDGDK